MKIRNKTSVGKSFFIGEKRIVFKPGQVQEVSEGAGQFLIQEFGADLELITNDQGSLIVGETVIPESQELITENKPRRKRTRKTKSED